MLYFPPQNIAFRQRDRKSVFLAGSIEMGKAEDWQAYLGDWLLEKGYNVFNPRRKDWNASWVQSYDNPEFSQQVHWEINALDKADHIIMYLDPKTTSPVSLIEFGLYAPSGKLYMVCPDGFYRKGNIEVVCSLRDVPLFNTIKDLMDSHIFK